MARKKINVGSLIAPRRARGMEFQRKTSEAVLEFMQLDFESQVKAYNRSVEAANKAIYRLKKSGADVSAFTDIIDARELMTPEGRFRKFGKETIDKYQKATEAAQNRAEDYLLKDFEKLKTVTEGVGKTEYKKRVEEKKQLEAALNLDEPLTWEQFGATKALTEEIESPAYYAILLYAEEVGYIPDLSAESQPALKKSEYMGFLKKVNKWMADEYGTVPTNAVKSLEDLKRLEAQVLIERPRYMSKKYEDTERKSRKRTGSRKLGL